MAFNSIGTQLSELPTAVREELDKLASDDAGKRATAIVSLGEMGQQAIPAIPFLIGALGDTRQVVGLNGRFHVYELAEQTLAKIGEPARQALLDALQAVDIKERDRVMWALAEMKETRAVEPLIRLLGERWRADAAEALGDIGDPRAVEPLLPLLLLQDDIAGERAAVALGKLKDVRAVEPLIAALKKDNGNSARDALKEITGQDLRTGDDWARWWEQNKDRLKKQP